MTDSSFVDWLTEKGKRTRRMGLLVFPLIAPLVEIRPIKQWAESALLEVFSLFSQKAPLLGDFTNLLVLVVFSGVLFWPPRLSENEKYMWVDDAVTRFDQYWRITWFAWVIYYLLKILAPYFDMWMYLPQAASLANDACFVLCYLALLQPDKPRYQYAIPVLAIFATLAATAFIALSRSKAPETTFLIYMAFGLVEAISMALVMGRLESIAIKPPLILVLLFYAYAALQIFAKAFAIEGNGSGPPLWAATHQAAPNLILAIHFWILAVAALLKGTLFIFLFWMRMSGVLLFYMFWMGRHAGRSSEPGMPTIDQERKSFLSELNRHRLSTPTPEPNLQ